MFRASNSQSSKSISLSAYSIRKINFTSCELNTKKSCCVHYLVIIFELTNSTLARNANSIPINNSYTVHFSQVVCVLSAWRVHPSLGRPIDVPPQRIADASKASLIKINNKRIVNNCHSIDIIDNQQQQ